MAFEDHFLESVVDVFGRGVLVGVDLVDHDSFFCLDFVLRKCCTGGQFEEESRCLREVFLQDGCVEDYLLLGCECVEFASQLVEVTIYYRGASVSCTFEYGVLHEMSDAAVVACFIPCSALYA